MKRMIVFTGIFYLLLTPAAAEASLGFLKVFIARTHPDCEQAMPTHHRKFCRSFEASARCACQSSGLTTTMCENIQSLHHRMLAVFSSEQKACQYQRDTSTQKCLDSWSCYWTGGKDSKGRLCQSTGAACQHASISNS